MLPHLLCLVLTPAAFGSSSPNLEVVNGEVVSSPDDFPFVAVQYNGSVKTDAFCGGTLISPQWVLTAAHCLYDTRAAEMKVGVQLHRSDYSKPIDEENGVDRALAAYHVHPQYSVNSWEYDLALLKLESPVKIAPVTLDDGSQDWAGKAAVVLGWGATDVACTKYDSLLRRGNVTIATDAECSRAAGGKGYFDKDLNICAAKRIRGKKWIETGCGDSGGPLLVKSDGHWVLTGAMSWGYGNALDIYMRTYGNLEWIKKTIAADSARHAVIV